MLLFEWNESKAAANLRKPKITFAEAHTVFLDELSIRVPDPQHSKDERRFQNCRTVEGETSVGRKLY
jgi:uncharacterized protein